MRRWEKALRDKVGMDIGLMSDNDVDLFKSGYIAALEDLKQDFKCEYFDDFANEEIDCNNRSPSYITSPNDKISFDPTFKNSNK